ncbi:MAG: SDR family oxidoreductase [Candidatus Latescibacterota bacterium]
MLPGRCDNTTLQDCERTMAVNVRGVFLVSQAAVLQMRKQGGGVIAHNASVAATKGLKDRFAYGASKGAVWALTKAMAMDYIRESIRVNCVNPGTTLTPPLEGRTGGTAAGVAAALAARRDGGNVSVLPVADLRGALAARGFLLDPGLVEPAPVEEA